MYVSITHVCKSLFIWNSKKISIPQSWKARKAYRIETVATTALAGTFGSDSQFARGWINFFFSFANPPQTPRSTPRPPDPISVDQRRAELLIHRTLRISEPRARRFADANQNQNGWPATTAAAPFRVIFSELLQLRCTAEQWYFFLDGLQMLWKFRNFQCISTVYYLLGMTVKSYWRFVQPWLEYLLLTSMLVSTFSWSKKKLHCSDFLKKSMLAAPLATAFACLGKKWILVGHVVPLWSGIEQARWWRRRTVIGLSSQNQFNEFSRRRDRKKIRDSFWARSAGWLCWTWFFVVHPRSLLCDQKK